MRFYLKTLVLIAGLLMLLVGAWLVLPGPEEFSGTAKVRDGDSLVLRTLRQNVEIRLSGIDAPEFNQSCLRADGTQWQCGRRATEALSRLVANSGVQCRQIDIDRYERVVADCFARGENLAEQMVLKGMAVALSDAPTTVFGLENQARSASRGIWNGEFQHPSDYRADNPR